MKNLLFTVLFLAYAWQASAQQGYSSASYSMGKQRSDGLQIPKPSEIVPEEYFNYHTHALPLPAQSEKVRMDMRWGFSAISTQTPEAVLQVGFTTHKNSSYTDETPLNICIVIDRSGSMAGDRIQHARQSAVTLVEKLRSQDKVSIVVFDSQIETLLENESAVNKHKIKQVIQGIQERGSTDLNGGLIRGYEMVSKYYLENGNNKVLLLTDVLTNTGTVDVEEIVKNANNYSKNHQIGITLVAIGVQVNDGLARQITQSGKHSFHYVNDSEDIKKIFVDEVEAIFSTIAKEVQLTLEYDENLVLDELYGYAPAFKNNKMILKLNNMNAGLTQVVLAKFKAKKPTEAGKVTATLTYYDVEKKKQTTEKQTLKLAYQDQQGIDIYADSEVRKCVSIAQMANTLKEMAIKLDNQSPSKTDYMKAKDMLDIQIGEVKKRYQTEMDKDVQRVLTMLENYAGALGGVAKR